MKETFYFKHDFNARNDIKMQAYLDDHGAAGYGIFWTIIEILHEEQDHLLSLSVVTFKSIAKQMSTSVEQVSTCVKSCIEYGLLTQNDDGTFYSERVNENIGKRVEISEKRSMAGKISSEKRNNLTSVEHVLTSVEQNPTKKRKENIKEIDKEKTNGHDFLSDSGWVNDMATYNGIQANYPKLLKMKRPLLFKEHERLVQKHGIKTIKDIYRDMEAWADLLKKREWAAGVADKWASGESKKVVKK